MPGVVVTTAVRTGPSNENISPTSTFFVCGTADRGPTNEAKLITSLAEFETLYGTYTAGKTLHQHVQTYFEEGGSQCYVVRVAGTGATIGTLMLDDSGANPALKIDAANAGSWSEDVDIEVVAGTGGGFILKLYYNDVLKWTSAEYATASAAATGINASSTATVYISATSQNASAVVDTLTATALSAGSDGSDPTDTQLVAGLDLFTENLGAGAVAIPENFSTDIYDGLLAHVGANNRIALLSIDSASSVSQAVTAASNYGTVDYAEHAAFYYPFVTIPGAGGTTMTISPESYVAAKRSVSINKYGPWQAGAGLISRADFVTGLSSNISQTDGNTLDAGRVNALRVIQNAVRVYGARSASSDTTNWRYITYRDLVNHVLVESGKALEDLVFSAIDGRRTIFGRMESRLIAILEPIRAAGGLFEAYDSDNNQIDPGYSVEVTDALNPVSQLADGLVVGKVGMRVSSVADQIQVEVVKSNLTSSVV